MTRKYDGRVAFAVQDFGASPLADRFGIDKYPAVFVDDALVARPEDFYAWGGPATGKYVPWTNLDNRRKFQRDLAKLVEIRLAGGKVESLKPAKSTTPAKLTLPAGTLTDLAGKTFKLADLQGKPVIVEFWATWCPPCLDTIDYLKKLDPKSLNVVAVAVESKREDIDAVVKKHAPRARIVIGAPDLLQAFDGPPAVPTLVLADAKGRIVKVFYGAPPTLHADIEKELEKLKL
ncbi:MAG TPA: TlpA disulfide reductase family protein [Thermoanaerobaculia bacterium]